MGNIIEQPISRVREQLKSMDESLWIEALGRREGKIYRKVWRVIEGLE